VDDPLTLLRAATGDRHAALDRSDWFARATFDLPAYAAHIARVCTFYRAAETALDGFLPALAAHNFEPDARRKRAQLERERAELPSTPDGDAGASAVFPAITTLSGAIGSMYVLEGSTLGGVVLAGRIQASLGRTSRFYGIYGSRTGAMWRSFVVALGAMHAELDTAQLVTAAVDVFDAYKDAIVPSDTRVPSANEGGAG
jgi:heme oxygenase